MKLLVANRGEIAIRILRGAAELDIPTVAVYSRDDAQSLHTGKADEAYELDGIGPAGYLDVDAILAIARQSGADAIHPGYGFLSENADFARRCEAEGITFIGPTADNIELFGDKARARQSAVAADVPVTRGIDRAVSVEEAQEFFASLGEGRAMMIKAIAGGGGRGSRVVMAADEVAQTFERCQSEAQLAFGNGDVYVEEFITRARHVEVQILGDLHGGVAHLGERECSIQRRFQKVIEIAPAPALDLALRDEIIAAAVRCAESVGYSNAGTFEFLVDASGTETDQPFAFIEANARLQVEHTVTEEVTGVDIVQAQLRLAQGATIAELGLDDPSVSTARGYAIQARVCMESISADGTFQPAAGVLSAYEVPSGTGVRTDGFGYTGYPTSLSFDSLLAKVIAHSPSSDFRAAITRTQRALDEFRIEGVDTNIPFMQAILEHEDFATGNVHTRFVDETLDSLAQGSDRRRFIAPVSGLPGDGDAESGGFAGARVADAADPLALFNHDSQVKADAAAAGEDAGPESVASPADGTVIAVYVEAGQAIGEGQPVAIIESLGLRHLLKAPANGRVALVHATGGDPIARDASIADIDTSADVAPPAVETELPRDGTRSDLIELNERRSLIYDAARQDKVDRRHAKGQRTAREDIDQLLDAGSFREYGPLVTAGSWQKQQWLRETTPTDGIVMGIGSVNGDQFGPEASRVAVAHYDYMVVAGTQGGRGHYKQDRLFEMARRYRLPMIMFAEGGGGRPGISGGEAASQRTSGPGVTGADAIDKAAMQGGGVGMDTFTFTEFSFLSGLVPMVGINSGRCFAGNTALLACCDVIIAAANSTIAMGGPAMIEGGGLGIYTPEEVGPMSFQVPNGVVDILVEDDEACVETAKKYLSYFQGTTQAWSASDQTPLRHMVPEDRDGMYDMRALIETLVDEGSILEIREVFGPAIITAFIRIEGVPMGLIASNPEHFSGAIDSDAADKAARFMQLCDTFDIPLLSLIDCPGTMAGPEYEDQALVRHFARLFNTGANIDVPFFCVVTRKSYGLGALGMSGASSLTPMFTIAWPTAEFSGNRVEALAELSARADLGDDADEDALERAYKEHLSTYVESARAVNSGGTHYGIDDVIDPADTRDWIVQGLRSIPPRPVRTEKKRPSMDTW